MTTKDSRNSARSKALLLLFAGVLMPLLGVGYIAWTVAGTGFDFDRAVLLALHRHATTTHDSAMLLASTLGSGRIMLPIDVLVGVALLWTRRTRDAVYWAFCTGGASLLDFAAKRIFERSRPELWLSIAPEPTYSFPSGHAMQTMAPFAAALVLAWPTPWRWPVLIAGGGFVLTVGLSRMYLGVHYPSDVLAGWLAAFAWSIGVAMVLRPRARHAGLG